MLIIGLTGGIGMGKSTAAKLLRGMKIPVHDADQAVHQLLAKGGAAVPAVAKLFPAALRRGGIDRQMVGQAVFAQPVALKRLERILHPLVRQAETKFLAAARRDRAALVVLDIPLLFETGAERRCDYTLCLTVPKKVQRARVLARPGMTPAKLQAILTRQLPDAEKRRRADFVVRSDQGIPELKRELKQLVAQLRED